MLVLELFFIGLLRPVRVFDHLALAPFAYIHFSFFLFIENQPKNTDITYYGNEVIIVSKAKENDVILHETEDDFVVHNRKKAKILSELDELDIEPVSMISANRPKKEKKHKEEYEQLAEETEKAAEDEWLSTISTFRTEKVKKNKRKRNNIFDYYENSSKGEHKKKKKKKGDELTDYTKEFQNESNLLKNLLVDQNKFVDSLQKKYDAMENTKSAQRGVGKFTTDLIMSINNGRNVSMQLIDKLISTKKTIADLSMKEKKEFRNANGEDAEDMNAYSANFLKKMLSENRNALFGGDYDTTIEDSDSDGLFDNIQNELDLADIHNDDETEKQKLCALPFCKMVVCPAVRRAGGGVRGGDF